jgi:Asp-tRNA(Asn)/Glu-tRNA(Gln) amidotransferase A subunit family amidase
MTVRPGTIALVAQAVRDGSTTATLMVERSLERIATLDGELGAVVALRADEARAEAAAADARRREHGPSGPLDGVPVLIKDLEDVAGLPTRKASLLLADAPPAPADGVVAARLRAAGAILVGKSTLPEFAIEGYTASRATGITRNPWNTQLSPGGSSGGSAAAIAAGMVPFATATDGGGSARIPASFCGLVGLKPTNGLIGRDPIPDWIDLSTDGVMATTVGDVRLVLDIIAGPVPGDPTAWSGPLPIQSSDVPQRLIAAYRTSDLGPLPSAVATAFDAAVAALSDLLQLTPSWLEPAGLFGSGDPDLDWFLLAAPEHVAGIGRDVVIAGMDRFHQSTREFLTSGLAVDIDAYLLARRRRFDYIRVVDELLRDNAILVTPTVAAAGFLADGRLDEQSPPGSLLPDVYSTALQNMTGHPAISVPAGMLPSGLPFGLQLTASRFADDLLLRVAQLWENAHPWPLAAPGHAPFYSLD